MKCYYEELGVPRDASDADIKTAYRKMALRWHPDKNLDALDEAKERFQLLQQAYEVLSDPQERAWYDNHRDQILRGKNSEYTENCLDVFEYFTSSCFRGYEDDDKGFYAVYGEVFKKIAAEDSEFMDDEDEVDDIPTFGDSKSSYEEVVAPFYAYWQAYWTKKTYAWLCPYNINEIRDRRVLREVEKEMKKIAQKARKERNEEVRNLVSFVRRRDKRVQAYRKVLEERTALNRKKQEQNRLEQIRKRQRELEEMRQTHKQNNQHLKDDYEEQLKQLAQDYSDSSAEEDNETDDEEEEEDENEVLESAEENLYVDDLYCVACNKAFKNEGAYANHETSKKHREALARIKIEMQAEEEEFQGNSNDEEEGSDILLDNEAGEFESDNPSQEKSAEIDETINKAPMPEKDIASADEELPTSRKTKKNKKARKNAKLNKSQPLKAEEDNEESVAAHFLTQAKIEDSDEEDWNSSAKKLARKNKNKKQGKRTAAEEEKANSVKQKDLVTEKRDQNEAKEQTVVNSVKQKVLVTEEIEQNEPKERTEVNDDSATSDIDILIKKHQPKPKNTVLEESNKTSHLCVTCKANFPSKNKLFAHLKITNHGVYIPKVKVEVNSTSDGKSKKGKGKKK